MTLAAHDLNVVIGAHTILDHVSLDCDPGTVTALTGASGSGKTTLLNCLGLLSKPTSGTISIDDKEATAWSDRQRRRFWASKAAFIYQDYGIIEEETVLYNVTLTPPGIFRHRPRPTPTTTSILETVGLSGREGDSSAVLSGGEKQRVGIARATRRLPTFSLTNPRRPLMRPTATTSLGFSRTQRTKAHVSSSQHTTNTSSPKQIQP